jgi:thioredoxin-related protein
LNKSIVDGLERDLADKAEVIRLDVLSRLGRQAAAHYGVRGTPTVIVVDGQGQPVLTQLALVRPGPIKEQVDLLLAQVIE